MPLPEGFRLHDSARLHGDMELGPYGIAAQGAVLRGRGGALRLGQRSLVLENSVVIGTEAAPVEIGQHTVFGHRCLVIGARVGHLCEIGNGAILMPGVVLGDGCNLGEGALVPAGTVVPPQSVLVGRPARRIREATDADRARILALRGGSAPLARLPFTRLIRQIPAGAAMGKLYAYRDKTPQVHPEALLFESAELTGDVHIGAGSIIGPGVKIVGDSHGPVRIGEGVQVLENAVLHLLPDNELVIGDGVVIGPGCVIHGCRLGAGCLIEPGAQVSDWSVLGKGCVVRAGSVVKQRSTFPDFADIDGFPAKQTGTLEAMPPRPSWAYEPGELPKLVRG